MTYPEYQDALTEANIEVTQLPFYIKKNEISGVYPLHHHDFMELSLVYDGHGFERLNGRTHPMRHGTASILLPHHIHEIQSDPQSPIRLYCCMFDMSILFESSFDAVLGNHLLKVGTQLPSHFDLNPAQTAHVIRILDELYEEHLGSAFMRNTYIRIKLMEVLTYIIRSAIISDRALKAQTVFDHKATRTIMMIVQYLHMNYREPLSLKALSEMYHLSVPYISRLFKEQTGQNFIDYIHALRIKRALTLLASTNMSIQDIAIDAGFEQIRTFSRVFRSLVGTSASEYRNSQRRNDSLSI